MTRYQKPVINFNADDVWAAAVVAQRTNGAYVKVGMLSESNPEMNQQSNRQIMESLLADPFTISDEDRAEGKKVRAYFQAYTFKILQGRALSEFNNTAMLIANRDTITSNYDVAVICSLPASYAKGLKRDDTDRRINFARGGYVGDIGGKVTLNIEVLKQVWSEKYNTWYLTGITGEDQVVFFAHKTQYDIGTHLTIQGVVKGQRETSTQLNRVKVI